MKRILFILLAVPVVIVLIMGVGFAVSQIQLANKSFPAATGEPNWPELLLEDVPSLVTVDPGGERRITQAWIAGLDGLPYLRTGDTGWFANLQRTPELELRIGGAMYLCRASVVRDEAKAQRVHDAFHAKYPRRSDFFRLMGISTNKVLALNCNGSKQ